MDEPRFRDLVGTAYDRGHHPAGVARQLHAITTSGDRTKALRRLDLPALVIHGSADPLVRPAAGRATARAIPGASFAMIEGMGHDFPRGASRALRRRDRRHARRASASACRPGLHRARLRARRRSRLRARAAAGHRRRGRRRPRSPRRDRALAPGRRLRGPARRRRRRAGFGSSPDADAGGVLPALRRAGDPADLLQRDRPLLGRTAHLRARCVRRGRVRRDLGVDRFRDRTPSRFPAEFVEVYGRSAAGREAPVRLRQAPPPGCERRAWTFRATDEDVAGHVNNSHYWAPLEEELAGSEPESLRRRDRVPRADVARARDGVAGAGWALVRAGRPRGRRPGQRLDSDR